jgi:hypothetical protein
MNLAPRRGIITSEKPMRWMRSTGSPVARATARFKDVWFMGNVLMKKGAGEIWSDSATELRSQVRQVQSLILKPLLFSAQGLAAESKRSERWSIEDASPPAAAVVGFNVTGATNGHQA